MEHENDKFAKYYSSEERQEELSQYVHENFKLIMTKMASEMRRKLNITPDLSNSDGYVSLYLSLQGRLFNEMVYSMCGSLQGFKMTLAEVLPPATIIMILDLIAGKNPLNGMPRTDVADDLKGFQKYYLEQIDELRKNLDSLPKD